MTEGVAEVEERPHAGFALVLGYDGRLELTGAAHGIHQCAAIAGEELFDIALEPIKERRVERNAVLDHLGEPGAQLAIGKRIEHGDVADHGAGLVEGADQVLASRMIDRRLAPHRGIDLREERGRHLDEGDTALVDGGGEAGEIADDTATERDDKAITTEARGEQSIDHAVERSPGLGLLAILHY